jgi:flagellar FliL protein
MAKSAAKQEAQVQGTAPAKNSAGKEAQATPAAEAKPQKKGRLLKIVIALVVLTGGAGGAWYAMQEPAAEDSAAEKGAVAPEAAVPKEKPPVFVTLEPFTVNLQPDNGDQYLQVGLVVKVTETATTDAIKQQMPEIRNRVLLLLSSKKASEISTVAGKQQLSTEVMNEVRQPLGPEKLQQGITGVLFTSFIIQ